MGDVLDLIKEIYFSICWIFSWGFSITRIYRTEKLLYILVWFSSSQWRCIMYPVCSLRNYLMTLYALTHPQRDTQREYCCYLGRVFAEARFPSFFFPIQKEYWAKAFFALTFLVHSIISFCDKIHYLFFYMKSKFIMLSIYRRSRFNRSVSISVFLYL